MPPRRGPEPSLCLCVCVGEGEITGRRLNFDRQNAPTRLGLSFVLISLFLDAVDHEEVLALLLLIDVRRCQRGLGADRLESDKGERAH